MVGVEQILDFWQNLPEFPFSTRHYQWSFFFEFKLGRFDHHIHWFFILANITGSHFNDFSISEITFIFALCNLPISKPHPMIVHRKGKPCDQKQRVSGRGRIIFEKKRFLDIPVDTFCIWFLRLKNKIPETRRGCLMGAKAMWDFSIDFGNKFSINKSLHRSVPTDSQFPTWSLLHASWE